MENVTDSPGGAEDFDVMKNEEEEAPQVESAANVSNPANPVTAPAVAGTPVVEAKPLKPKKVKAFDDEPVHIVTAQDLVKNNTNAAIKELKLEQLALQYSEVREVLDELASVKAALAAATQSKKK